GVDEETLIAPQAFAEVDPRLLLVSLPPEVEVPPAALLRLGHGADLQERPEAIFQLAAPGEPVEDGTGVGVLGIGPCRHLGRDQPHAVRVGDVALQPAVVVDDLAAMQDVRDGSLLRFRWSGYLRLAHPQSLTRGRERSAGAQPPRVALAISSSSWNVWRIGWATACSS